MPSAFLEPSAAARAFRSSWEHAPSRRSGTFLLATPASVVELPPASSTPTVAVAVFGAIGLVAFPLTGAALLGDVLGTWSFVVLSTIAATILFASVAKLESPFSGRSKRPRSAT